MRIIELNIFARFPTMYVLLISTHVPMYVLK